ncbi:hypothetical protein KW850_21975 [Bacillus sp. sid0103]|nr:hypothetical protein [Bacillus sp. sid0103]MBV7507889.1 hypothetical protein [Bacillus sp. sid0103]
MSMREGLLPVFWLIMPPSIHVMIKIELMIINTIVAGFPGIFKWALR